MVLAAAAWTAFVPAAALVFAVASFWWLHLRRGRLKTAVPDTYAYAATATRFRIRFPLAVFNPATAPVLVESLRLSVEGHEFPWMTIRRTIRPTPDDVLDFPAPFSIDGKATVQVFAEFGADPPPWRPDLDRSYRIRIDRRVGTRWKPLVTFDWWPPQENLHRYIAHPNRRTEEAQHSAS